MQIYTTVFISFLVFIVGGLLLQVFLSRKESKILGLILPLISFLYSIIMIFNLIVSKKMTGWAILKAIISSFIGFNIYTIILLVIYFTYRGKEKLSSELEKMNIRDLD